MQPVKKHAVFSPSEKYWINYDREKIISRFEQVMAVERGTALHEFAAKAIELKVRLAPEEGIIANYVSDCIDLNVDTEVELTYTNEINGTADAIKFDEATNTLYIFDLKTGSSKASLIQVMIYAALWCLSHWRDPLTMNFDLRIYHNVHPERDTSIEDPELNCKINDVVIQMQYVAQVVDEHKRSK